MTIADFDRHDECCGFGGTFSVTEEALSAEMGNDKLGYMAASGARYIVSAAMSCLMRLRGCASRDGEDFEFYCTDMTVGRETHEPCERCLRHTVLMRWCHHGRSRRVFKPHMAARASWLAIRHTPCGGHQSVCTHHYRK